MIWAVPVKNTGRFTCEPGVVEASIEIYCIGAGTQPWLFFGVVPTNLTSKSGFIWIKLVGKPRLKELRRAWPLFKAKLGWNLIAFTACTDAKATRFAEFFGLRRSDATPDLIFFRSE